MWYVIIKHGCSFHGFEDTETSGACLYIHTYNVLSFMSSLANSSQVNICPVDPPVAISASPQRIMSKIANSATGCKTLTRGYVHTQLLKLAINME